MKKQLLKMALSLLCLGLLFFVSPKEASAANYVGGAGPLSYSFNTSTGALTIYGTGAMPNYTTSSKAPWDSYAYTSIVVEEGVTSIGNYAFYQHRGITSVSLPSTLTRIGTNAFAYCSMYCTIEIPSGCTQSSPNVYNDEHVFWSNPNLSIIASGTTGEVNWSINGRTLNITGSGRMADYTYYATTPWYMFMGGVIDRIVVSSGVTHIGDEAFGASSTAITTVSSVSLPSTLTSIGDEAFAGLSDLASVSIPGSVTELGTSIFYECDKLSSVTLGYGLKEIGYQMFYSCPITSIQLPATLEKIGYHAFHYCDFTEVTLPSSIRELAAGAFYGVPISEIILPEGLEIIGNSAFASTKITEFILPSTIRECAKGAFSYNSTVDYSALKTIGTLSWVIDESGCLWITGRGDIPDFKYCGPWQFRYEEITSIYVDSLITSIGDHAFDGLNYATDISIGYGPTKVGHHAFSNCTRLTAVNLPSSVTSIGEYAFQNCYLLSSVTLREGITSIGTQAFYITNTSSNHSLKTLAIPASVKTIGSNIVNPYYTTVTSGLWIKDTVGDLSWHMKGSALTVYGTGAMPTFTHETDSSYNFDKVYTPWWDFKEKITAVYISEGITSIGNAAFYKCTNLTYASLPSTLKEIKEEAFEKTALSSVTIPQSVTTIGADAFANTQLTEFTFPKAMKTVGGLSNCYKLTKVTLPDAPTSIDRNAFMSCTALSDIAIPETVTSIGIQAFCGTGITEIVIPASVTEIPGSCFSGCKSLVSVTFHDGITSLGNYAFSSCSSLTAIDLPENITVLPNGLFDGCSALASLEIPQSVTTISQYALQGTTALATVVIPETVTTLNAYIFQASYNSATVLKNIIFEGNPPATINANAFFKVKGNVTYIPTAAWTGLTKNYGGTLTWVKINGACGENASWRLDSETALTLFGAGEAETADFAKYAADVTLLTVEDGITGISADVLAALPSLSQIIFRGAAPAFTENHFAGLTLKILYPHSQPSWNEHTLIHYGGSLSYTMYCPESADNAQAAFSFVPQTPANCTEAGEIAHYICVSCGAAHSDNTLRTLLSEEELSIPALHHSYLDPVFHWAEDGSSCEASFACERGDDEVKVTGEISSEQTLEPGCVTPGETTYTASFIFLENAYTDTLILADIPFPGHVEASIPGFEATCVFPGLSDEIFCEVCGETIHAAEEIPALGHKETITLEALLPTCAEDGYTAEIHCSVCGELLEASVPVPATGDHTEYVNLPASLPTCTEDGNTEEIICSVCNAVLTPSHPVPAEGHSYGAPEFSWEENGSACIAVFRCEKGDDTQEVTAEITSETAKEPDCENMGDTLYTASLSFLDQPYQDTLRLTDIPALGHTAVSVPGKAPTAHESGLSEGSVCGVCGEVLQAQEEIPALFTYDGTTITAYNGTDPVVVIPGDATALGNEVFKNNAFVTSVTLPESITAIGTHTFYGCSALKDIYLPAGLTNIASSTFHNTFPRFHVEADTQTAVALSYRSKTFYTKDGFGLRYRVTSLTGTPMETWLMDYLRNEEAIVLPAQFAGTNLTRIEAGAFADLDQLQRIQIPDTVKTIATDAFTGCGENLTILSSVNAYARTFAANNNYAWQHDVHEPVTDEAVPATCTATGLTEGSHCETCGDVIVPQEEIPALGHTEVVDDAVPATCTATGLTEGSHCETCGETLVPQEEVPALGHTEVVDDAVPATCTETGLTEGSHCETCGETLVAQEEVPALGHTEVTDEAVPATCTEPGKTEGSHCETCGKTLVAQEDVPAQGHTEVVDDAVPATCTATGLTEGSHCETCGETLVAQEEVPALGHTEVTDEAVPATCTATGLTEGSHCETCGDVIVPQEEIPALGHTEVTDEAVPATCTEPGKTEGSHCETCGETLVPQEEIPALGHSFGDAWMQDEENHWQLCLCGHETEHAPHADEDTDGLCDECGYEMALPEFAPDFILPEALTEIGEEAFAGMPFTSLRLPVGVTVIPARAFAESALLQIYIPETVTEIAENAFENCSADLIIFGVPGSRAESFAQEKGFRFIALEWTE